MRPGRYEFRIAGVGFNACDDCVMPLTAGTPEVDHPPNG